MHDMPHSEESKKKMSDSHKGIVNNARITSSIANTSDRLISWKT